MLYFKTLSKGQIIKKMESRAIIGNNVKAYRERLHYTQDAIADYLGVKREAISYYENGHREIDLAKLEKLADLFNVELEDLISEGTNIKELDMAFAFRSDGLIDSDLAKLSDFQKIIKNFIKMKVILNRNDI